MDPPETAGAECALKEKVGESIGTLWSTLVGKEGVVYGMRLIYALTTFAAFTGALC